MTETQDMIEALIKRTKKAVDELERCKKLDYSNSALHTIYDLWNSEEYLKIEQYLKLKRGELNACKTSR